MSDYRMPKDRSLAHEAIEDCAIRERVLNFSKKTTLVWVPRVVWAGRGAGRSLDLGGDQPWLRGVMASPSVDHDGDMLVLVSTTDDGPETPGKIRRIFVRAEMLLPRNAGEPAPGE